jgi:hypothetical protein
MIDLIEYVAKVLTEMSWMYNVLVKKVDVYIPILLTLHQPFPFCQPSYIESQFCYPSTSWSRLPRAVKRPCATKPTTCPGFILVS